jgi:hypothetical protein
MTTITIAYYLGRKKDNSETTFFDRLVCFATRSRYSHLEYVVQYNEHSGKGVCWSSSPRDGGVRQTVIALDSGAWELYEVEVDKTKEEIEAWFEAHKGSKYDWVGAFATKVTFLIHSATRWFCSEALGASFGFIKPSRLTPEDIFCHFKLRAKRIIINSLYSRAAIV